MFILLKKIAYFSEGRRLKIVNYEAIKQKGFSREKIVAAQKLTCDGRNG